MFELVELTTTSKSINELYKKGSIRVEEADSHSAFFFILTDESKKQSALTYYNEETGVLDLIRTKDLSYQGFSPKDAAQSCFFWALKRFELVVALGAAGTGKTTVALAYALNEVFRNGRDLILCKPTAFVGLKSNAIAAIPGDHREKLEGYMDSYMIAMRKIMGEAFEHHLYQLEEEGRIQFKPFELLRGQHFENAVVVLDEAQNTTPHELLTAISRVGNSSTVIVMGDPDQVDLDIDPDETGLYKLINSLAFSESPLVAGVKLTAQYRGPLAQLAGEILNEIREEKKKIL
jgi:phosphate starvation-inducible PhoH-like protein